MYRSLIKEFVTSTSHIDILILIRLCLYKLPTIMCHKDNDLLVKYGNLVVSFNLYILENTISQSMINIETRADPTNHTPRLPLCPVEAETRCFSRNLSLTHPNDSKCKILHQGGKCLSNFHW